MRRSGVDLPFRRSHGGLNGTRQARLLADQSRGAKAGLSDLQIYTNNTDRNYTQAGTHSMDSPPAARWYLRSVRGPLGASGHSVAGVAVLRVLSSWGYLRAASNTSCDLI